MRRVRVNQVRGDGVLNRAVSMEPSGRHIYQDRVIYWMWRRKRKGSRFLGETGWGLY